MNKNHLTQENDEDTVRNYLELMGRYERLLEISRRLNSTLNLKALLGEIIDAAIELTDTEVASILLLDSQGELRFEAGRNPAGAQGDLESIVVPMDGSIAGWIVRHGEPMLIEDVRNHPRHFQQVDSTIDFSTRNMLGVPLRTHEKTIGALEAINKRGDFTEDDINTLTALAAQAAVAIENARLFQQSDLISEMVHELRTPLAALTAIVHILERPDLPEERSRTLIGTIKSETGRLNSMTTDFLDLARLESKRWLPDYQLFSLKALLTENMEIFRPQAAAQMIHISVEVDPAIDKIEADRGKLTQVLSNLLTNAIKYNRESGEIFIKGEMLEDRSTVQISVRDTGHGISEKDQQHIFEKFFRVADTEGYAQGTGLGLTIAKRIVEAHDGTMWLESELDVGTTFFFTLPLTEEGYRLPS